MIGQLRSGGGGGRLDKPGAKPSKKKLGKNRLFLPFSCPFVSVPFSMKKKNIFFRFFVSRWSRSSHTKTIAHT